MHGPENPYWSLCDALSGYHQVAKDRFDAATTTAVEFEQGDKVLLYSSPTAGQDSRKFVYEWVGPYSVTKREADSYIIHHCKTVRWVTNFKNKYI